MTRLIIPGLSGADTALSLKLENNHPAARYGRTAVITEAGHLIDARIFRFLRDELRARVETDCPAEISRSLGVSPEESGITLRKAPATNSNDSESPECELITCKSVG